VGNPKLVGPADLLVMEDVCSRTLGLAVYEDMADDNVARILATAREGGSQ
jgi:hypothetical protein